MTFKEAYDKIIEAYFEDKLLPMTPRFCFCGTLAREGTWCDRGELSKWHFYTKNEYTAMEAALLFPLISYGAKRVGVRAGDWTGYLETNLNGYEDALFNGMNDALDVLRQIHESRGEVIEPFEFKKRELATV